MNQPATSKDPERRPAAIVGDSEHRLHDNRYEKMRGDSSSSSETETTGKTRLPSKTDAPSQSRDREVDENCRKRGGDDTENRRSAVDRDWREQGVAALTDRVRDYRSSGTAPSARAVTPSARLSILVGSVPIRFRSAGTVSRREAWRFAR
jgi:hypothetical protein